MTGPGSQRVLLLGAGGFLGRQIGRTLRQSAAWDVTCAPGSAELDLTLAAPARWDALLREVRPDVIVNAAGRTEGSPTELHAANVTLVSRWLGAVWRFTSAGGASPWLVHLGSAAEYGPTAPDQPVREPMGTHPQSAYGKSKLEATQLMGRALRGGELQGVVVRVFNPVGAGQAAGTLPGRAARLLERAVREGQAQVTFGPLSVGRDFLNVRDVAGAVAFVAARRGTPALLNVASGQAHSARALVKILARLAQFRGQILETGEASMRSAAVPWQQADVGRLRALGWAPAYSLEDALEDLWHSVTHPPDAASAPPLPELSL